MRVRKAADSSSFVVTPRARIRGVALSRGRKICLVLASLLVAALIFCLGQFRDTPAHRFERRLQAIYQSNFIQSAQVEARQEALQLLNDEGTNAIPLLVQWLQWEPHSSPRLARMQNWSIWDRLPMLENAIFGTEGYRRACAAAWAFELLGTNAALAAPALQKLTNGPAEQTAYRAEACLQLVTGPK